MVRSSALPATAMPVSHAPDPRIDLDDPVEVLAGDLRPSRTAAGAVVFEPTERTWGWVTGIDLPLTVGDGAQRTDVGVSA